MKEKRVQIQKPSYDACEKALKLLAKVQSELTEDEQFDYKVVRLMLEEMKFDYLLKDVQAIIELRRGGFVAKKDIEGFIERRPELQGTTLGETLLSLED